MALNIKTPYPASKIKGLIEEISPTESYPNGLKASSVDSPMFFPSEYTYQVGSASVTAMCSNAISVGTGQTGSAPLYVFCADGVYALMVDQSGEMAYTNARIIARDVCNNAKSVTPIDAGVVFTTDRGLMCISGEEVQEIGMPLEGDIEDFSDGDKTLANPNKQHTLAYNSYTIQKLGNMDSDTIAKKIFLEYLKNSIVNYNHNERELMISNTEEDIEYSYVMDRNGQWSRRDYTADEYVNNYPTSYRVKDGDFIQVDRECDDDNSTFIMSNVIKLDSIGFKELNRFVARGSFEPKWKSKYGLIDSGDGEFVSELKSYEDENAKFIKKEVTISSEVLYSKTIEKPSSGSLVKLALSSEGENVTYSLDEDESACKFDSDLENDISFTLNVTLDDGTIVYSRNFNSNLVDEFNITVCIDKFEDEVSYDASHSATISVVKNESTLNLVLIEIPEEQVDDYHSAQSVEFTDQQVYPTSSDEDIQNFEKARYTVPIQTIKIGSGELINLEDDWISISNGATATISSVITANVRVDLIGTLMTESTEATIGEAHFSLVNKYGEEIACSSSVSGNCVSTSGKKDVYWLFEKDNFSPLFSVADIQSGDYSLCFVYDVREIKCSNESDFYLLFNYPYIVIEASASKTIQVEKESPIYIYPDIDFSLPYTYKLFGRINTGGTVSEDDPYLGLYIFGSYDGRKWALLGHREKTGKFNDIGALVERTDCKFFRFVLAGQLSEESRLDYFEVSSKQSPLSKKIR